MLNLPQNPQFCQTDVSSSPFRVLNCYAGIGGNRKLWNGNIEVTAIEYDENIAAIYKDLYPNDKVIATDAHKYLIDNYENFDFIWCSPPCQTHSILNFSTRSRGDGGKVKYPDMKLYQEIIVLQTFFKGKFCVENVAGYYEPLIKPQVSGRHYFWANFKIPLLNFQSKVNNDKGNNLIKKMDDRGIYVDNFHSYTGDKRQLLNNCVEPEIGLAIFESALNIYNHSKVEQVGLFSELP